MSQGHLRDLIVQSLKRHTGHFLLASIGVIIGVATLLFFTSLGEGVRTTVLQDIFVIDRLEVVDPAADAGIRAGGSLFAGAGLTDRTIDRLQAVDGVQSAYPRMKLTFPSRSSGGEDLIGESIGIEYIGDGIPTELAEDDASNVLPFADLEAPTACSDDADCHDGMACSGDGQCQPLDCADDPDICTGESSCHAQLDQCLLPIPLVISPYLLEVYNGSIHTALGDAQGLPADLPRLTEDMLVGFEFDIVFGESFVGPRRGGDSLRRRARIVGFSDRAIQLGATMPIAYVERLNERFAGEEAADIYHSILVETERNEDVPAVTRYIQDEMGLELSDRHQQAERAGLLILLLTLLFNLIALIILVVAALNITHTFSMMVMRRRDELGLMRALGATRKKIALLVIGEATVVGLLAGLAASILAYVLSIGVDLAFDRYVGDFPFKPDTLFAWSPWMLALGLAVAILFCLVGAWLPARRASRVDPADALTGR